LIPEIRAAKVDVCPFASTNYRLLSRSRFFLALKAKSSRQEKVRVPFSSLLSLNWLFAALALGLVVYGVALRAAIMSGAWFGRERTDARG
jgi:hypothetical protein